MTRDLKLYFLLICLPAVILTGLGLVFLHRQSVAAATREHEMRVARIENLAASLQDVVNENGKTGEVVRAALRAWRGGEGVRSPVGAFAWSPKAGLVWATEGIGAELRTALGELARWNEWTAIGKKRARRGFMTFAGVGVLWGRVENVAYGVVFEGFPLEAKASRVDVWLVGGILVVLLACVLTAGAWLMVRAAAKARRDDMTKTTFLSNCSHELKTPLAGIGIWIDLLLEGRVKTEERRTRAYEIIAGENARMTRLVENLLNFSRLEQGRRRYVAAEIDLSKLTADAVDLVRADFREHGIEVRAGEGCMAWADPDAVKQILVNLLGNAAKYAAAGGPVEVTVTGDDKCVRVAVADRGPGLAAEQMARVFDRFYRADDALTAKTGGLGLGLSISRALARDMNGDIMVAARPGGGCVFTLELPHEQV
ncbi:MAG: sensor histidine kinase [Kiritimatiellia bacterium]